MEYGDNLPSNNCHDHSMLTTNNDHDILNTDRLLQHFSHTQITLIAVYLFTIALISLASNLIIIVLYCKDKSLQTNHHRMLINLCVADIAVTVFGTCCKFYLGFKKCYHAWTKSKEKGYFLKTKSLTQSLTHSLNHSHSHSLTHSPNLSKLTQLR